MTTQILIFGASTTYGVGGMKGGWPDHLKLKLHQQMYDKNDGERFEIYNLGIPGATSRHLLENLEAQILYHSALPDRQSVIVIHVGGNDSKAVGSATKFVSTPDIYKQNLERLIELSLRTTDKILCVGLSPVDDARTQPYKGGDSYFSNERIGNFESTFAELCGAKDVPFVSIFEYAQKLNWNDYLYVDGLHPNDLGQQWIFEQVWPKLEVLLNFP